MRLFSNGGSKGQLFILFTVVLLAGISPLFLSPSATRFSDTFPDFLELQANELPQVLNSFIIEYPQSVKDHLRGYYELIRRIFKERGSSFEALTVLGFTSTDLTVFIVNYGDATDFEIEVNGKVQILSLSQHEIMSLNFDKDSTYSVKIGYEGLNETLSARDSFYWSKWIVDRDSEHFEVLRSS